MKTQLKKSAKIILLTALLAAPFSAQADWFGGNNGEWKMGPNGPYYDDSGWPEWTPMYWMDEMMDAFDSDSFGGNNWGSNFGGYNGYNNGYNNMPYGNMMPNGYNYNMPYLPAPVAPAPQVAPAATTPAK